MMNKMNSPVLKSSLPCSNNLLDMYCHADAVKFRLCLQCAYICKINSDSTIVSSKILKQL